MNPYSIAARSQRGCPHSFGLAEILDWCSGAARRPALPLSTYPNIQLKTVASQKSISIANSIKLTRWKVTFSRLGNSLMLERQATRHREDADFANDLEPAWETG